MERRNVVFSVVQDRSKVPTFAPTVFKMSTPLQPTAEKSVQTQDLSGSTTHVLVSNNPITHIHTENTAAEVANTLVSMATGRQRATTVKQLSVISVPTTSTLPILSLADYTTSRGVPTAVALANQAKLTPTKQTEVSESDSVSMSTDDYNQTTDSGKTRTKSTRSKSSKSHSSSSHNKRSPDAIQYGPIVVKPRRTIAPTLANGRKSKDTPLPPDEDMKRRLRRDRNKQAAAKCRRKRNDLREQLEQDERTLLEQQRSLEQTIQTLADQKSRLEMLLQRHSCTKKTRIPISTAATPINTLNISKSEIKTIPTATLLDPNNNGGNNKRVTINFTNAQDLFAIAPLTRLTSAMTTDGSSTSTTVPMITIHILPEVAQALLGSATVDKNKLAELIQQGNVNNSSSSSSSTTIISDSTATNTSANSTT